MVEIGSITSRRALLTAIAVAPIAVVPGRPATERSNASLNPVSFELEMPSQLGRSRAGRNASRFRYHNAESFFRVIDRGIVRDSRDQLYQTGIVLQLGLSSHLFDVGFTDEWCARHIGLNVVRSLAYANATGCGFDSPEFDLLAAILSPYSRWRFAEPPIGDLPLTPSRMRALTRELLDHVHHVTGHARPRGWGAS